MNKKLEYLVGTIQKLHEDKLEGLSSLKLKSILFLSQIEYYTLHGEKLFSNDIYCYYNDITIEGLKIGSNHLFTISDSTINEILLQFTELLEHKSDDEILSFLYQSKAFLKANVARQNRLTKKILEFYHKTFSIYTSVYKNSRNPIIDEVEVNYHYVDDIIDDLEIMN